MSIDEVQDVSRVLEGYEQWRKNRIKQIDSGDAVSVSAYVDEIAKQRAVDALAEIRAAYDDPDLVWTEVDSRIRGILGGKS